MKLNIIVASFFVGIVAFAGSLDNPHNPDGGLDNGAYAHGSNVATMGTVKGKVYRIIDGDLILVACSQLGMKQTEPYETIICLVHYSRIVADGDEIKTTARNTGKVITNGDQSYHLYDCK